MDDIQSSPETTPTKPTELRKRAIEEIISSENRYIEQLEILQNFFIKPLKERNILDAKSHTALFGQVEMIYNLNRELLHELDRDLNSVAKAFLKLAPFFKLYSVYAFDFKNALIRLQELTVHNQQFKKFLDETETRPEVQMKLNSLLITPIQRIPRYKLLLHQVLLYTSPSQPDYKDLSGSVKEIENTVQHINSVIEDQEHTQSLINLQNSLTNRLPSIVKPSRRIVKEGILEKVSSNGNKQKYYCVLMSDIFMYCRVMKKRPKDVVVENSLQCCCIFPLRKTKVIEMFSANFKITCQGDGNIFHADTDSQCRAWVSLTKEMIDKNVESRKTLRKESSKKRPMRKKDVRNFEANEQLLSPPQKGIKYDYENLYRCVDETVLNQTVANDHCFHVPRVLKKKRTFSEMAKDEELAPGHLEPAPKRSTIGRIRSWFGNVDTGNPQYITTPSKSSITSKESTSSDPTYGFTGTNLSNQTYFHNAYEDKIIPIKSDLTHAMGQFQSSTPLAMSNNVVAEKPEINYEGVLPSMGQTKRVHFSSANQVATESYFMRRNYRSKFELPTTTSIKDKIFDFFSKFV